MKQPDYSWQQRCIDEVLDIYTSGGRDFLANVTPGAGKTRMAVNLTTQMLKADLIDFVVVVVPTSTVRDQFIGDMEASGVNLAKLTDSSAFDRMKAEGVGERVQGFCLTTGLLLRGAEEIAILTARNRVLFVSDEAHHNGLGLAWADAGIAASKDAALRLGLSGTPYRSDAREIPILRYDDAGLGTPHYEFTFAKAREAGIITAINFRSVTGHVDVVDTKVRPGAHRYSYDEVLNPEGEKRRLRYSVNSKSPYVKALIESADDALAEIQQTQPGAAGIVFANTKEQAKAVAKHLRKERGRKVRLIHDDDANEAVAAFKDSKEDWIVQVRKVYEGANIPRLRVGAYLTNWTTEGFFDQASKRLVRRLEGVDPDEMPALMFMPADPVLESIAAGLGEVIRHDPKKNKNRDAKKGGDGDDREPDEFLIVDGEGKLARAIIEGSVYSADDVAEAVRYFADDPVLRCQPPVEKMMYFAALKRKGVVCATSL
jgi:superfamily II DNA or RNA helicase